MRYRRHRHAATAAALLATLAVSACSDGANGGVADGTDGGSAAGASRGLESSSSSSSSPTPSLLPPVVTITPGPDAAPDSSALGSPHTSDASPASPSAPEGPLVESATWADSDYGATLKIAPTEAGRLASDVNAAQTAWREVLALAPNADTPGMWEQFDCHWTWARIIEPNKPTWNVEPWRPMVDESQMLTEGCNPGGPEV